MDSIRNPSSLDSAHRETNHQLVSGAQRSSSDHGPPFGARIAPVRGREQRRRLRERSVERWLWGLSFDFVSGRFAYDFVSRGRSLLPSTTRPDTRPERSLLWGGILVVGLSLQTKI